ncbi:MAG: bifunctional UDP-N-acetylglucosamine diphosphorylase/glucosamine-1-phosphate N-acetyltransferase GlmU, partial [Alphaproteobacteria bacterium]
MSLDLAVIILAAGKGTRMKSDRAKVLHEVANLPMIGHAARAAESLDPTRIIIVHGPDGNDIAEAARTACAKPDAVITAIQHEAKGTGHAVLAARESMAGFNGLAIVAFGDTPLLRPETFTPMVEQAKTGAKIIVMGFEAADPGPYGRLVTDKTGTLIKIVEAKDASPEEAAINLVNGGIMAVHTDILFPLLDKLTPNNAQGEYYLTDLPALAREDNIATEVSIGAEEDVMGINSRIDLAAAEKVMQQRLRHAAMAEGATLVDPDSTFFSYDTKLGRDVWVGPNVWFGPGVTVADNVEIKPMSHLEGATVASDCWVGPYGRLRPGAELAEGAKVGNFVEIKKATLAKGAKVSHLTYIGDASVGEEANIGAGTITCNYDGF